MICQIKWTVFSFLFFHISGAISQDSIFFVNEATWHYDAYTVVFDPDLDEYGIYMLNYTRDTIVEGLDAVFIEESSYNSKGNYNGEPQQGYIMRQEGRKIYQYTDYGFKLLYDFSAQVNDTISISPVLIHESIDDPDLLLIVDSVAVYEIDGRQFPEYYYHVSEKTSRFRCRFRIGFDSNLAVTHPLLSDYFYAPISIRCYQDSSLFINFVNGSCDNNLISATYDSPKIEHWTIYPNPTTDQIKLLHPTNNDLNLKILDIKGQIVFENKHYNSEDAIYIEHLPPGLYQITVNDQSSKNLRFFKL